MLKPHVWRLALVLLLVAAGVLVHAWIVADQARRAASLARDELRISLPHQLIRPEFTVDGHMWIRHAENLVAGEGPQLRRTSIDNSPHGREVHWNSGYAWWLAGLGWTWHKITGLPLTQSVEQAAMWVNVPLLLVFSVGFGVWSLRRGGVAAALTMGLALFGHRSFYEGFWPGYADHHGITLAAILGLVLGAYWMRGGWIAAGAEPERAAVQAARWSGFWGAVALWISAASAVPAIALVAAASLLAIFFSRGAQEGARVFAPRVWRNWGRAGALASLGFYLLEYFPHHLGWRLEVNHPLYALAWLAGGELMAALVPAWVTGSAAEARRRFLFTAAWALPLAMAPAVVIVLGKAKVFLPSDPFMIGLHRTITEFLPLWQRLPTEGLRSHYDALLLMPALYLVALLALWVRGADRWALLYALATAVPLHAMGFWQSRWAMSAAPGQVLIVLALIATLPLVRGLSATGWRRVAVAVVLLAGFYGPGLYFRGREAWAFATQNGITAGDGRQLVYREVAQMIRESQPEGEVVLFGSPNTSVNVAFYGNFKTLGTLYWENLDGLKAAAEISSARTDDEAARLLRERGVTHLAFFRDGNYILEFAYLLNPQITEEEAKQTFGYRLLGSRLVPVWLEALPYAAPDGLPEGVDKEVLVFKVNFEQRPTEAAYRLGLLQARRKELDDALSTFELALRLDPANYPAALRRAEIYTERRQWRDAAANFDLAVQSAPAEDRYRLLSQTAIAFNAAKQRALSIAYYERALRETVTNVIAPNNLAWLLATAPEEDLRNPARALELATRNAAFERENPSVLGTLAAALAANGRFDEAVARLEQGIALAEARQDTGVLANMRERLTAYRAGRIWLEP